ncbi:MULTISPECIES: DegQ family serine endoprotease [Dyella]|uniref:Probable periplasmic serine endoprotease DegP-like n=2 Tax=Dyella TaxID=231454 RepID=A0A4R0YU02_9GAMM|nr:MULTISPECIES: DegQ family serine endoprotease [Dyella]TBR39666.1 DegQ family serine endoprotease [Dyella terrae]TCI12752.1 DegQ family serine endoprotease [Dyella soli]
MKSMTLRRAVCCALVSLAVIGGAQAQTPAAPAAPVAGLPDFTGIVQKNAPAVVHVEAKYTGKTARKGRQAQGRATPDDPQMDMFRRFFGMPMMPSPEEQQRTSLGSGFIISADGYILTNTHVVDDADTVTVRLQDRRTLTAKVVGSDPQYDIALLKVDAGGALPFVSIGDSRTLKPGQWVLAIGSPFGFDYTVTQGIVSAVGRNLGSQDQPYTSFIQTDVPINRGNSGGPLFDLQGRVVGVNSQIYSNTGGYLGVAFSIPIDVAMNVVKQIKEKGYVTRGQLGVMMQPITDDMAKAFKLGSSAGAAVTQVSPGSGAEKAGLKAGDVILAYNGQAISQVADLPPLVGMTPPGSKATLQILRDGKKQDVTVTVGEMKRDSKTGAVTQGSGEPAPTRSGTTALGLSVEDADSDTRKELGLKAGEGVVISDITGPVAARAGLQPGDVILMVNQQRVGSAAAFRDATKGLKAGDTVLLLVRHGDQSGFVGLTVPGKGDDE